MKNIIQLEDLNLYLLREKLTVKKPINQFNITFILSLFFLLVPAAVAQWEPDIRLTNDPAVSDLSLNNARCIAISADTIHVVWGDLRTSPARRIYYKRSINNGMTWEPDVELTTNPAGSGYPSVAVYGSIVHITWTDVRNGNYDIYYKRSTDNGISWGFDIQLTTNSGGSRNSSSAVSGDFLHVVFRDNRNGNEQIYYKRSTDSGLSWGDDTRISNTTSSSEFPSVSASAGNVFIVWQDNRDGNLEIYSRRSTDNGANWEDETKLTDNPGSSQSPSVIISNNLVNFLWQDNRDGNYEIYYMQSFDYGVTWSAETRLTENNAASTYPSVIVSGEIIHAFWQDNRDGNSELYYKQSTDSGISWESDLRLTDNSFASQYVSSAVLDSALHIVWQDNRDGNFEIYYKKKQLGNSVGIDDNNPIPPGAFELFQNFPNPFNPATSIQYTMSSRQFVSLKVFDPLGREVSILVNEEIPAGRYEVKFNATGLSSGIYFYELRAGSLVETKKMILLR